MANYLVIKLSGNWIEQEQNKKRIQILLQGLDGVAVLEKAAVKCQAAKLVMKEMLYSCGDGLKDRIKTELCRDIGEFLEGQGCVTFEEKDHDKYATAIFASVVVIKEGE